MAYRSEDCNSLPVTFHKILAFHEIIEHVKGFRDVCMIILPPQCQFSTDNVFVQTFRKIGEVIGKDATLITLGEPIDLVHVHPLLPSLTYQSWVSIKRKTIVYDGHNTSLPAYHLGALIHTNYTRALQHTVTRIQYTYCPACEKTTKDYGGKKHTYNSYGTLISDVWRDIACDLEGDLSDVIRRFADLFGVDLYHALHVLDCRDMQRDIPHIAETVDEHYPGQLSLIGTGIGTDDTKSRLILGDSLKQLRLLSSNSIDFAFIDPPYNLGKTYHNYSDALSIQEYFSWCDDWIREIARILKPGHTLAILNIPLWAIRHVLFMETVLIYQNWIAWDALSFPVRKIMPAHYAILCFSKGISRHLPGLLGTSGTFSVPNSSATFLPLHPLAEWYCLRTSCVRKRNLKEMTDRGHLTDLWWDIHRLKHNSRRVDHPCQLPPQLMYRLISIFTEPGETVLDCFNGSGTTTLAAHQLNRHYIGIELSEKYHQIAETRHQEIQQGIDPFRKADRQLTEKNSRVPRMPKQHYKIPKKTLQLEVRRVSLEIGRIPSHDDMIEYGKYPIQYYDEYFASWGEVCAAARHDGMSEEKKKADITEPSHHHSHSRQIELFG